MLKEQPQFPCLFVLHRLWTWMIIARPLTSSTLMEVVTGQSAHKFGIWESDIIRLCKFVIRLAPTSHTQFPFLNPHRSQTSTIHPKRAPTDGSIDMGRTDRARIPRIEAFNVCNITTLQHLGLTRGFAELQHFLDELNHVHQWVCLDV